MTRPRTLPRLLVAVPLALVAGLVGVVSLSLVGWSLQVDASALDRVVDDLGLLVTAAVAGGVTCALLAWVLTDRVPVLLVGVLMGMAPAALSASAFFTDAY